MDRESPPGRVSPQFFKGNQTMCRVEVSQRIRHRILNNCGGRCAATLTFISNGSLAYAELRLVLAVLIRGLDFELFKTTVTDVSHYHDLVTSNPRTGSNGVRVTVG